MDLAGSGTDLRPYANTFGGRVVSVALRIYSRASLIPRLDTHVSLRHLRDGLTSEADDSDEFDIQGPLAVFERLVQRAAPSRGFELTLSTDLPPLAGLADTASLAVATTALIWEFTRRVYTPADLAREVTEALIDISSHPWPRHDAWVCAVGGLNDLAFPGGTRACDLPGTPEDAVLMPQDLELTTKESVRLSFEQHGLLFATGLQPDPDACRRGLLERLNAGEEGAFRSLHQAKATAQAVGNAFAAGDSRGLAALLYEDWNAPHPLCSSVFSGAVAELIARGAEAGAIGAKLCALDGSCIFFACEDLASRQRVLDAMKARGARPLPFLIDDMGVRIWSQPQINS